MPRTDVATAPDPDTDTEPVALPPHKPALRRSHSAASACSLPTPPRTRKRKRGRGGKPTGDTDSEAEIDGRSSGSEADEEEQILRRKGAVRLGSKKRKVLQLDVIAAELSGQAAEDAFWTGEEPTLLAGRADGPSKADGAPTAVQDTEAGASKSASKTADTPAKRTRERSATPDRSPSASPPARLLKRNRTGLLSPPKSHRRRSPRTRPLAIPQPVLEEPATPPARRAPRPARGLPRKKPLVMPERDSPNNPFLDSASASSPAPLDDDGAPAPRRPHVEKPTITYVFRGVRTEFANPLYDARYPETGVAPRGAGDDPAARDPRDPDFEPDELCPPKLLFPAARRRPRRAEPAATARERGKSHERSEWDTTDEEDNAGGGEALALPRTPAPRRSPRLAKARADEGLRMPEKDRSDAAKRAFGPREREEPVLRAKGKLRVVEAETSEVIVAVEGAPSKARAVAEPSTVTKVRAKAKPVDAPAPAKPKAAASKTKPHGEPVRAAKPAPATSKVQPHEDPDENPFL